MIKLENYEVVGWEHAIRGMRNPMNSWDKSDSKLVTQTLVDREIAPGVNSLEWTPCNPYTSLGPNDRELMMKLRNAGTDHRKFLRMITVYADITAPLYWWKEFKTYRAGRKFGDEEPDVIPDDYLEYDIEMNSCSTMHKIHAKEFEIWDFSFEKLIAKEDFCWEHDIMAGPECRSTPLAILEDVIHALNIYREKYLETKDKVYWEQMIQLLPTSYNQRRTLMLNYEVLANMYKSRKNHKLDEWREFCAWIEELPYSELITGADVNGANSVGTGNLNKKPDFTNHDGSHDYD